MARLAIEIEPHKVFRLSNNHKYFQGVWTADNFIIERIVDGETDNPRRISGVIAPAEDGALVRVAMEFSSSTKLVRALLMFFAGMVFILTTVQAPHWIATAKMPPWLTVPMFVITPLASLVFAWALPQIGFDKFDVEMHQQKEKLAEIFGGLIRHDA